MISSQKREAYGNLVSRSNSRKLVRKKCYDILYSRLFNRTSLTAGYYTYGLGGLHLSEFNSLAFIKLLRQR